jgi:acyl carrier protein
LQKLEILVRIEREYGVKLTDVEATRLTCVADAAALLGAKGASR